MADKIRQDVERFKKIVNKNVKENLKHYIQKGSIILPKGNQKYVQIPITRIEQPRFKYGPNITGVGHGDGEEGDVIGRDHVLGGAGSGGEGTGDPKEILVDVNLDDLVKFLGEALKLPNLEDKGKKGLYSESESKSSIIRTGPESLKHFKRTYKEALKRAIMSGIYDPVKPIIIPERIDKRYRYFRKKPIPTTQAVVIYMMDMSASMEGNSYELVQYESFFIELWLKNQYKVLDFVYILHDASAIRVGSKDFRTLFSGKGTKFSPAYSLCDKIINEEYHPSEWNIYPFHFTDGENFGGEDDKNSFEILEKLIPVMNQFSYCQVKTRFQVFNNSEGRFAGILSEKYKGNEKVVVSKIASKEDIPESIKAFLGRGN